VLSKKGELLAVGKAVLSAKMMRVFECGVAVKVRAGNA
jgi:archaeosine-15-forming tRNA-guanine transglycosylase